MIRQGLPKKWYAIVSPNSRAPGNPEESGDVVFPLEELGDYFKELLAEHKGTATIFSVHFELHAESWYLAIDEE